MKYGLFTLRYSTAAIIIFILYAEQQTTVLVNALSVFRNRLYVMAQAAFSILQLQGDSSIFPRPKKIMLPIVGGRAEEFRFRAPGQEAGRDTQDNTSGSVATCKRTSNNENQIQGKMALGCKFYMKKWLCPTRTDYHMPEASKGAWRQHMGLSVIFPVTARSVPLYDQSNWECRSDSDVLQVTKNMTVSAKGPKMVNLLSTSNKKLRFTVTLSCLADGTRLCPCIIFRHKTLLKGEWLLNVVVCVNKKGSMNEGMLLPVILLVSQGHLQKNADLRAKGHARTIGWYAIQLRHSCIS